MEAALSIWFPRVDTVYNEQIPPAPGFLTGEFGPTIGAVFMKARTPGFLAGGSFMLASTSITGLGLGVESVQGSNGYADFGGFFQLDATFVSADALFLRNSVHLMPLCVRLYLVAGRLSPTQSFQSGFRGEYQLRFTPPGDWVASIAAGATVIAGAPNLGFTTTAFIGREL
ncbi:MAG TPA: hypothetical protein VK745_30780 [Polyangiaceae bacterium]|nr:hypothetical protein [Polyangiaceae bacterium]